MSSLGDFIREKRIAADLSLRDCAKLCGISHTRLDCIEKGSDPNTGKAFSVRADTLKKIAAGLNIDFSTLLALSVEAQGIAIEDIPQNKETPQPESQVEAQFAEMFAKLSDANKLEVISRMIAMQAEAGKDR